MNNMTRDFIYAIKQSPYNNEEKEIYFSPVETAKKYMSEATDTPEKYYTDNLMFSIVRDKFEDYLKTADNPAFAVWELFEHLHIKDYNFESEDLVFKNRLMNGMLHTLIGTQVRAKDLNSNEYYYVNGFSSQEN